MTLVVAPKNAGTIGSLDVPRILDSALGDFIMQGLVVSTNASQSTAISITSGSCVIGGFGVTEDATGSIAAATSATNYIFIQLTLNGSGQPTSVAYIATTVESTSNAMRLAKVISTTIVSSVEIGAFGASMNPLTQVLFVTEQLGGLF